MKKFAVVAVAFFVCTLFVTAAFAQGVPKIINGGVLNGKAVRLPKPEYPEWARSAKLEGTVVVDVVIDEEGNVASAVASSEKRRSFTEKNQEISVDVEPADGSLRDLAERAALDAKFAPTRLSGVPVKVRGSIVYKFVLSDDAGWKGRTIAGGVLNAKAVSLPLPPYPEAAAAVKAGGPVTVQVTVDESGNVISAVAVSGHPLLRPAAVDAARMATFSPLILDGEPARITGMVSYVFTP